MPKAWTESVGKRPFTVRIEERTDRSGRIMLQWREEGKRRTEMLDRTVRDDRGRLRKQLQDDVRRVAREKADALRAGSGAIPATPVPPPAKKPLTLRAGVETAMRVGGLYAAKTQQYVDMKRNAERAIRILGPGRTWEDLRPVDVAGIWRTMARKSGTGGAGPGTAVKTVTILYKIAEWLREQREIPDEAAHPPKSWRKRLKEEWVQITGRWEEPSRPRHSREEASKIMASLQKADPRLWLLVEVGAELRAGQVTRTMRSDLDLSNTGGYGLGKVAVRGRNKKTGEVVDLHPELRGLFDLVLKVGYLSELETAYQRGEISDYPLFPQGPLRCGKSPVARAKKPPMYSTTAIKWFHELEQELGIEPVHGRAFYGLRRFFSDFAPDYTKDDRVLDRLTGHLDPTTRIRVYQDRQRQEDRARAADVRRKMREGLRDVDPGPDASNEET